MPEHAELRLVDGRRATHNEPVGPAESRIRVSIRWLDRRGILGHQRSATTSPGLDNGLTPTNVSTIGVVQVSCVRWQTHRRLPHGRLSGGQ